MRITNLRLDNFLVHRHINLPLTPLSIVAGPNEAGKSSIRDGLSFAILGTLARIDAKGERERMLSYGTDKGSVTITCDASPEPIALCRDILTGKPRGRALQLPNGDSVTEAVPYCLDMTKFARAGEDERRNLLLATMRVSLDASSMKTKLVERGHTLACVTALPHDNQPGWMKFAAEAASEARGGWKAITGETYGAVKAETWTAPTAQEPPDGDIRHLDEDIHGLQDEIAEFHRMKGVWQERANQAADKAEYLRILKVTTPDPAKLEATIAEIAGNMAEAREAERETGEVWRNLALEMERPKLLHCTACGTAHILDQGVLKATQDDTPAKVPSVADVENAHYRHSSMQESLRSLEFSLKTATARLEECRRDHAKIAEMEKEATPTEVGPDLNTLAEDIRKAQATLADKVVTRQRYSDIFFANKQAATKTAAARKQHEAVKAWTGIAEAVAPGGLPAELLTDALAVFNGALTRLSAQIGWPSVSIGQDMRIWRQAETYRMLSESGQWKTDLLIAVALAFKSGFRVVVADRFDVLDIPSRKPVMAWLYKLAGPALDTVLLMGTLREPPAAPKSVSVTWLEGARQPEAVAAQ